MRDFEISTDSTCDLYFGEIKEKDLFFLPLTFSLNDKGNITEHKDTFSSDEEYKNYYDTLRKGIISKTSMNNPTVHEEFFTEIAKKGVKRLLHFTISYGLCRTVDVARQAVEEVRKTYPDFNCLCVECSTTTLGQGMLVNIAVNMRDGGKTLEEAFDYVESHKKNIQHFIIADDLSYLVRGGRLSAAKGAIGTVLKVKPIIVFNKEGKLVNYKKERGLKHAVLSIAEEYGKYTINKDNPQVIIGHTDNLPMAKFLKETLKNKYGIDAEIRWIGPVIGSHLGPDTIAYIFMSNEERPL